MLFLFAVQSVKCSVWFIHSDHNVLIFMSCDYLSCSVGKSTILTMLTGTHSEAASYEFTTLTCIPGIIHYNDTKIQLLDLPGIIEGASEGKGRGRQVYAANSFLFLTF
jgi:ribosome-binding ATPase YchF (GTP1/OBG family)